MDVIEKQNEKMFEDIKHVDKKGNEYWEARELQRTLEYKEWRKFENVITKAKIACEKSDLFVYDHFVHADKMVGVGSKTIRKIVDYKLSRYACYLIAQNADSRKKIIALAQTYFAIQTRKMEIIENEYSKLTEDEKRLYQRNLTKKGNYSLNQTAKRKGLRYREDILDNMGSDELIINLFRISQTEQKLRKDSVKTEHSANMTHYKVGTKIRETIKELDGILPEDLPTPKKSIKELEKEEYKKLNHNKTY